MARRFAGAALVTGASVGIGEAFARALARRGMDLVLVARRRERLSALAAELERAHGRRALVVAQDLAEPDAADPIARAVRDAGLDVGLLVNNAGFGLYGAFDAQDPVQHARMVDVNCRAPVLLTQRFLPAMLERGRGGLVFVASTAAYQPTPWFAVYGATKAFDLMLAEALWAEVGPRGIEVLAVSPGSTPTEFQSVASSQHLGGPGGQTTAEAVVEVALSALGRKPSVVPGMVNKTMAWSTRLAPRGLVAKMARRVIHPDRRGDG